MLVIIENCLPTVTGSRTNPSYSLRLRMGPFSLSVHSTHQKGWGHGHVRGPARWPPASNRGSPSEPRRLGACYQASSNVDFGTETHHLNWKSFSYGGLLSRIYTKISSHQPIAGTVFLPCTHLMSKVQSPVGKQIHPTYSYSFLCFAFLGAFYLFLAISNDFLVNC